MFQPSFTRLGQTCFRDWRRYRRFWCRKSQSRPHSNFWSRRRHWRFAVDRHQARWPSLGAWSCRNPSNTRESPSYFRYRRRRSWKSLFLTPTPWSFGRRLTLSSGLERSPWTCRRPNRRSTKNWSRRYVLIDVLIPRRRLVDSLTCRRLVDWSTCRRLVDWLTCRRGRLCPNRCPNLRCVSC